MMTRAQGAMRHHSPDALQPPPSPLKTRTSWAECTRRCVCAPWLRDLLLVVFFFVINYVGLRVLDPRGNWSIIRATYYAMVTVTTVG
jgi:hypothetical protein